MSFDDQVIELLPERTVMTACGAPKCRPKCEPCITVVLCIDLCNPCKR